MRRRVVDERGRSTRAVGKEFPMEGWHVTTLWGLLPFPPIGGVLSAAVWLLLLALLGRGLAAALHGLRLLGLPPRILAWGAVGCGGLLLATLAGLGALVVFTTPESYREGAWRELQAERHPLLRLAERADQTGVGGALATAREGVSTAQEKLRSALAGHGFGVPALEALKAALLDKMKPPPAPPEDARRHRAIARLQLGPTQAALYQSEVVLSRAKSLRQGRMADLQTVAVVLGGVGLVLLLAQVQAGRGGRSPRN
jgi:hypothetical protein